MSIGLQCPGFLADPGGQAIMTLCTQAECDAAQVGSMQRACCPDGWPCDSPQCDSDGPCLQELLDMGATCPNTLLAADGVSETLQRCEAIQQAAAAAGVDDETAAACVQARSADISHMHRSCCPDGWGDGSDGNAPGCEPTEDHCGQEETECLGRLNDLIGGDCAALSLDAGVQSVLVTCGNYAAGAASVPGLAPAGRGGAAGRGGRGGRGSPSSQTTTQTTTPTTATTDDDDTDDDTENGNNIGLLLGGLLVIVVAGAAFMKSKGKAAGAAGA